MRKLEKIITRGTGINNNNKKTVGEVDILN